MQEASDCLYQGVNLLIKRRLFSPSMKTRISLKATLSGHFWYIIESENNPITVVGVVVVPRPASIHITEIVRVVSRTKPPVSGLKQKTT